MLEPKSAYTELLVGVPRGDLGVFLQLVGDAGDGHDGRGYHFLHLLGLGAQLFPELLRVHLLPLVLRPVPPAPSQLFRLLLLQLLLLACLVLDLLELLLDGGQLGFLEVSHALHVLGDLLEVALLLGLVALVVDEVGDAVDVALLGDLEEVLLVLDLLGVSLAAPALFHEHLVLQFLLALVDLLLLVLALVPVLVLDELELDLVHLVELGLLLDFLEVVLLGLQGGFQAAVLLRLEGAEKQVELGDFPLHLGLEGLDAEHGGEQLLHLVLLVLDGLLHEEVLELVPGCDVVQLL